MKIHFLNCFTCNARIPSTWQTGTLCLLVETDQGLILIDTGPGLMDYVHNPAIIKVFKVVTKVPLNPEEAAIKQISRLGFQPEDVRHIVLTHMHFDHCGGLTDFPWAKIHTHLHELDAFLHNPRKFTDLAYVRRHLSRKENVNTYLDHGETWLGLPAIKLPFQTELWLVPLFGHTRGHCGVAIRTSDGWLFHVADAGPVGLQDYAPRWLVNFVLGPHVEELRSFASAHPEVRITTGHMWLDFFDSNKDLTI